jgi:hypoxanthine phosphoribosyltransferase
MAQDESSLVDIEHVLQQADQLYSAEAITHAIEQMAHDITLVLAHRNPLILTVMNGGLVFAGNLLPRLNFPLQADYIHATRYGDATTGGALHWLARPTVPLAGRHVLILDDILDQGDTLLALQEECLALGASAVHCAVLVEKQHPRKADPNFRPDFVGLTVGDRFVFGFGMDYRGYWRNAPGIYAVAGL